MQHLGSTLVFDSFSRGRKLKFIVASFKTLDWMALQLPDTPICMGIQRIAMEFADKLK